MSAKGVLLVDDNVEFGIITAEVLRKQGHVVTVVTNGADGFETLRKGYLPNLILLDWKMPQIDGGQFLEAIRSTPLFAHIPVIIISGERPRDMGWLAYAPKPLEHDMLIEMVTRYAR